MLAADEFGTEKKGGVISLRTRPSWAMGTLRGTASRTTAVLEWSTPGFATAGAILYGTSPDNLGGSVPSSQATGATAAGRGGTASEGTSKPKPN